MERLTYDFCIGNTHCWQVKGADNFLCKDVCREQGDNGCEKCPIKKAFDRLAAYEDIMDLERAQELAQAEKDGRLVVLQPCKAGDCIFSVVDMKSHSASDGTISTLMELILDAEEEAPPPNDPLTLAELREMDGEPVWVVTGSAFNAGRGNWDICDWWDKNTVMFPYCGEQPKIEDCGITWTAYRRKPEEGQA